MAKLTDDERKLLDDLTARASEPDADDDFEIEVYDTTAGKGARIPYSRGSRWLYETLGIGDPPAQPAEPDKTGKAAKDPETPKQAGYFGRRATG